MDAGEIIEEHRIRDPRVGIVVCEACRRTSPTTWIFQIDGLPRALCSRCSEDTGADGLRRRLGAADAVERGLWIIQQR